MLKFIHRKKIIWEKKFVYEDTQKEDEMCVDREEGKVKKDWRKMLEKWM